MNVSTLDGRTLTTEKIVKQFREEKASREQANELLEAKLAGHAQLSNKDLCELIKTEGDASRLFAQSETIRKEWPSYKELWAFVHNFAAGRVRIVG